MPTAAGKLFAPALSSRLLVIIALYALADVSPSAVAEPDRPAPGQREEKRAQLLQQMKEIAEGTDVRYQTGEHRPQLVASPVFRYDDQPRRFLDATMWVWTDAGRPVAFQKIEAMDRDRPQWATLFTSVTDEPLAVQWEQGREYRSTASGVDFQPLPDAPPVPAAKTARKLAARKLIRDFSARILTGIHPDVTEEMRLLPAPIFEYQDAESSSYQGGVFGLTTSGTNPDVLILLEPRLNEGALAWHFSVARMTTCGVTLKYVNAVVWKAEFCLPPATVFPTWTVFYTSRAEPTAQKIEPIQLERP
ncbi:MAG TPA: hypothetical protein VFI31_10630 [Pirellulales bacterium]|nr:hypothetical protein [Pirellulales bacterium]